MLKILKLKENKGQKLKKVYIKYFYDPCKIHDKKNLKYSACF